MAIWHILLILLGLHHNYWIPSASMQPTLRVGDVLDLPLVHRYFFGARLLSDPQPGDVVVFYNTPTKEDYVKRVIALSGDRVAMHEGRLYINGTMVQRTLIDFTWDTDSLGDTAQVRHYVETLPNGVQHELNEISDHEPLDETREFTVPKGYIFVMGDNRDRSVDSRLLAQVGFVPLAAVEAIARGGEPFFFWYRKP